VMGRRVGHGLASHPRAAQRQQAEGGEDERVNGRDQAGAHEPRVYRRPADLTRPAPR
jgi:hypothetical protein